MKRTVQIIFVALLLLFAVSLTGKAFRACVPAFVILWLLCPVAAVAIGRCMRWPPDVRRRTLIGIVVAAGLLSFVFFAHYDYLRDTYAPRWVDGYEVGHQTEYDEFGRPWAGAHTETETFWGSAGLWLSEVILAVLCVGLPVLTWRLGDRSTRRPAQSRRQQSHCAIRPTGSGA